jgi:F0F1-type ATP synthase assembly protein I
MYKKGKKEMQTKQSEEKAKKQKQLESSYILTAGIIGGLLLGAILAAITHNPFPQIGIGIAVGVIIAACVMVIRKKI